MTKYPRTPHLPWSPGKSPDDIRANSLLWRPNERVVVTEKMDGENTTITRTKVYARSLDTAAHPSRSYVAGLAATFKYNLGNETRVVGENLFAKHSIFYDDLASWFLVFGVWEGLLCLAWEDTVKFCNVHGLDMVPVLFQGEYGEATDYLDELELGDWFETHEGYVIRSENSFYHEAFSLNVAKYVRANHVQTDDHWLNGPMVRNVLERENKCLKMN